MDYRICTISKDGRHNFAVTGQPCINGCGVDQYMWVHGHARVKKEEPSLLDGYIERLLARPKTKARNYMEEKTLPYLPYFKWPSDESFFKCMDLFWIKANMYYKTHTITQYEDVLRWGSRKQVHPMALIKVFNKKPTIPPWIKK